MTPEVATYLEMARTHLADARTVAALPLPHLAAREAYLAGYHAAEALVFARTGQAVKTHRGLRARFSELVRNDQRVDPGFLRFLARAYELKSIADYGGPPGIRITAAEATEAIDLADRLLTCVATIVADETTG